MRIVVPLAGKDTTFESKGMIKPLTKINGKEIIKIISESRPFFYENAIFIILQEHNEKYNLGNELKKLFGPKIQLVISEQMTEGSPQSILLAKDFINNEEELIIDLGDQYLDLTGFQEFLGENKKKCDGIIPTFEAYYWNQGYMLIESNRVKKISEKDNPPISTHSTACISYYKKGSDFVRYAEQMIAKKRTAANGIYLPSLVYNEMIEDNKKILVCPCEMIANLGKIEGVTVFEQINRPLKWKKSEKLILHRGYKGKYPENSLTSFKMALREGLPTEIDIRITKDNVPIIIHDDTLDRLFNSFGRINDKILEKLKQFNYKEDENKKIVTLEEFCEAMDLEENKKSVIITHIKELKDIPQTIKIIKKYDLEERFWFFAVDKLIENFIGLMKEKYSEYKIGLHLYEKSPYFNEDWFRKVDFIWADEITFKWITKDKVKLAHSFGKPFYAISPELIPESIFNSNIKERWKELLEMGVDGICTDIPIEFLEFIEKV